MSATLKVLVQMMEQFICGSDQSMAHVDLIEALLIERFRDSELFEELSPAVASYRPGGGEHLLDENALAIEFRYAIRRLHEEGELGSNACS